ncbi:sulfate transporter N-terminal domain with GLY motif-domain-containing protein [Mycena capillaripes]|nr:sulfate transporter N-terminal domain with GLY motif-domain-containing protein [Mycena capillaripes]
MDPAIRLAKRVVAYPENSVPSIFSRNYLGCFVKNPRRPIVNYLLSLFPILSWITRYNLGWLWGDLIAGLTVGMVLVPQGMSYAQIATLPPQYGLYSSFVGVTVYCLPEQLFATSKDVSIGPVAVASLIVSQIISKVTTTHPHQWEGPQIATTVAFLCGFIVLGVGLLRLGWIIEFIPAPAVSGFMTGSAISIAAGQVPGLMGMSGFDTRAATFQVIINTLKGLPKTTLDAAWGLPSLFALYAIQTLCDYLGKRYPRRARIFFFISVIRNAFIILITTMAAWLYCRYRRSAQGTYPIKVLQTVPRGFQHVGQPVIDSDLIGSCFGAYPATGSFSRSALKSKSGVCTPLAGLVTAVVVLVALYGLTPAFFWIPNAALSAVIIHAVANLVASPAQVYWYWRVSPLELFIWLAAVFTTVFSSVENGIYVSISTSVALLLIHIAHPRGTFLGKVTVHGHPNDVDSTESRDVFVPFTRDGITNPHIKIDPPPPGVIVYRFEESAIFPNAFHFNAELVSHVKKHMRRGKDMSNVPARERPWNDPGPSRRGAEADQVTNDKLPDLHAIVIDLSAISHIDITAVQAIIDTRNEVERWADHRVEFHFATLLSPWIRRALIAGGFGTGITSSRMPHEIAQVVPHCDGLQDSNPAEIERESDVEGGDIKMSKVSEPPDHSSLKGYAPTVETDTPFFHLDLAVAVRAAESGNTQQKHESRR